MGCSAARTAKSISGLIQRRPSWSPVVPSCQKKHDSQGLGEVLDLAPPRRCTVVIGDGAYDRCLCYAAAKWHRVTLISPPGKRAALHSADDWIERNRATYEARFLGRPAWKFAVGYHRRSLARVRHAPAQSCFRSAPPLSPGTKSDPRSAAACSPPQPLAHSFYRLGCLTAALPGGIRFMQQAYRTMASAGRRLPQPRHDGKHGVFRRPCSDSF